MSVGEAISHAAAPWTWRSRRAVEVLVVVCVAVTAIPSASAGLAAWRDDSSLLGSLLSATVPLVVGSLLFVRPSIRSWRRWLSAHPSSSG